MKLTTKNNWLTQKDKKVDRGFSLIETIIALTTLGICLAYAMPLFLYAKINNSKSEIRTGALIVSQRVFDDIRSQSVTGLPSDPSTPKIINDPLIVKAIGRTYQAKVTYCEGIVTDPTVCSLTSRKFKVEVNFNGSKIHDLEGNYTNFQ
jgi:prepilin-type N-terminal cleavage/methylation domain-containing protein